MPRKKNYGAFIYMFLQGLPVLDPHWFWDVLGFVNFDPPLRFHCKMRGLVLYKKWFQRVIFLGPHAGRALAFFSRKHF